VHRVLFSSPKSGLELVQIDFNLDWGRLGGGDLGEAGGGGLVEAGKIGFLVKTKLCGSCISHPMDV